MLVMSQDIDYVYDAGTRLEQLTGLLVTFPKPADKSGDGYVVINKHKFVLDAKAEIRKENKLFLIDRVNQLRASAQFPILVIGRYISTEATLAFKESGINYLDIAGNCHIREKDLYVYISGQKPQQKQITNQSKAFQEAGLKLIFRLLSNPDNIRLSYRELSELTGVSKGSISNVMNDLEHLHFVLKTKSGKILKNMPALLEKWVMAYHDVLYPRLVKKRMRFAKNESRANWKMLPIREIAGKTLWGGEPGAEILTHYLSPEKFIIYTSEGWQTVGQKLGLIPDESGEVEVAQSFWKEEKDESLKDVAPPLLVYADLMGSGYSRNIETAKLILDNELQHIK